MRLLLEQGKSSIPNETVSLTLTDVDAGDLRLSFALFAINTWDGSEDTTFGPDVWAAGIYGGATLLQTIFSNLDDFDFSQAHPPTVSAGDQPAGTGAAEIDFDE